MAQKKNNGYLSIATKLTVSLLITAVIFITALIFILHSSYGLALLQKSIEKLSNTRIQPTEFAYDFREPLTFYFKDLSIESSNQKKHHIEELNLTLAPLESLLNRGFVFQEVWLKGSTLGTEKNLQTLLPEKLSIKELSLEKMDLLNDKIRFNNADIQVSDWTNKGDWGHWEGSFLFSAQSARFADEYVDELIINGTKQSHNWDFWSIKFKSRYGDIETTASLRNKQISFEQLAIADANIHMAQKNQFASLHAQVQPWLHDYQIDIRRLDLLNSQAYLQSTQVKGLNLTANNLSLQQGKIVWKEETALNFTADSLGYRQWSFTDTLAKLAVSEQGININTFSSQLAENGNIVIEGKISPQAIELDELSLNGFDLTLNSNELNSLQQRWQELEKVEINKLSIKDSDFILAQEKFPVQIKDMRITGQSISALKKNNEQVWQGNIDLSADSANINQIHMAKPAISAMMQDNLWQFTSKLPFETGHLSLETSLNAADKSLPWQIKGAGVSIPNNLYQQWFDAKLTLQGEHDLDIDLKGLSITKEALHYSLSGELEARLHNSILALEPDPENPLSKELSRIFATEQPNMINSELAQEENEIPAQNSELTQAPAASELAIETGKIMLILERGQLTLHPTAISANGNDVVLGGSWDFVTQQGGFITQ